MRLPCFGPAEGSWKPVFLLVVILALGNTSAGQVNTSTEVKSRDGQATRFTVEIDGDILDRNQHHIAEFSTGIFRLVSDSLQAYTGGNPDFNYLNPLTTETVVDMNNHVMHYIASDSIYDMNHDYLGYVAGNGQVFDLNGDLLGTVSSTDVKCMGGTTLCTHDMGDQSRIAYLIFFFEDF